MTKKKSIPDIKSNFLGIEANPANQELNALYPDNLHKEIWRPQPVKGHSKVTIAQKEIDPSETLYRWWWEFMRASHEYPEVKANMANDPIKFQKIENLETKFGPLYDNFNEWWKRRGSEIFREQQIPKITVLLPRTDDTETIDREGVVLLVPMSLSREMIHQQLDVVLKHYKKEKKRMRHQSSTAELRIFPRISYHDTNYELLIELWKEKQKSIYEKSNTEWWLLYCNALIKCGKDKQEVEEFKNNLKRIDSKYVKKSKKTRLAKIDLTEKNKLNDENYKRAKQRVKYMKLAESLYRQAEVLMQNAILGEFPRDDSYQQKKRNSAKND